MALGRTVGELEETMTAAEFEEWIAYYQLEPFGQARQDIGPAIVASVVANVNAPKGKRFRPTDFLPQFSKQRQTTREAEIQMRTFAALHNSRTR